ncbi:Trigalactosyldiacylglycerol 4 protein [Thalictrum thalictroides]|uniref:Trigalactosyldiacylglycerol 4 protein n=1 Tax=Thalictrum thalictroides TaxID=46969 RepID=A0A7J6VKF1_THATH|nr:Trigalactosyldiacylglycerol 4 protein [Thalictrum thalictroides]
MRPYTRGCLTDCLELYSDAISSLNTAMNDCKIERYYEANIQLSATMDAPTTCEDGFKQKIGLNKETQVINPQSLKATQENNRTDFSTEPKLSSFHLKCKKDKERVSNRRSETKMANMRLAMDSTFWDLNISTPQTLDGSARHIPGEPIPLDGARASRALRAQQLSLLGLGFPLGIIPSYFPTQNKEFGSFSLQSLLLGPSTSNWWFGLIGQLRPKKLISSIKAEFSGSRDLELPAFQNVAKNFLDKSLYSLGLCTQLSIGPASSFFFTTERHGERKGRRSKAMFLHKLPQHDITLEAAWPELFIDRNGRYWDVPESVSLDMLSLISDSGLRYRFGVHKNSGSPQAVNVTNGDPPLALMPGVCAKASFSYEKSRDIWRQMEKQKDIIIKTDRGKFWWPSYDVRLKEPHAAISGIIGGTCTAWFGGKESFMDVNSVALAEEGSVATPKTIERKPFNADFFGSVSYTFQHGKFRQPYGDLTRVDTRLDICSASAFAKGTAHLVSNVFRSSQTGSEVNPLASPRLSFILQQQVIGPIVFRVDSKFSLGSTPERQGPHLEDARGIKKMRESLPPQLLKEKLPRFLQKCAQAFQADPRYHNDLRYVRVWIQLMDFVDDPRVLLKTMEKFHIGTKQALFYQAYALHFVKLKKFEKADKMYHLGIQNLAEPAGVLQKSYDEFLRRMVQYKKKRTRRQEARAAIVAKGSHAFNIDNGEIKQESSRVKGGNTIDSKARNHLKDCGSTEVMAAAGPMYSSTKLDIEPEKMNKVCNDETVVFKFADSDIVGKSEAGNACHHGLVEPTINMKEAMNAINNMFREPIPLEAVHRNRRELRKTQAKVNDQKMSSGFQVFLDEDVDGMDLPDQKKGNGIPPLNSGFANFAKPATSTKHQTEMTSPPEESFRIFDDEYDNECSDGTGGSNNQNSFVFPTPLSSESDDTDERSSPIMKFREDTVVGRFVGSAIVDEPEIENACHHGLVEPTINLKEAMNDINSMFGKPLDFAKTRRSKTPGKMVDKKRECGGFSILADEDLDSQHPPRASSYSSNKFGSECDLFEQTINTKKAMDDINEMFGMPLDF